MIQQQTDDVRERMPLHIYYVCLCWERCATEVGGFYILEEENQTSQ